MVISRLDASVSCYWGQWVPTGRVGGGKVPGSQGGGVGVPGENTDQRSLCTGCGRSGLCCPPSVGWSLIETGVLNDYFHLNQAVTGLDPVLIKLCRICKSDKRWPECAVGSICQEPPKCPAAASPKPSPSRASSPTAAPGSRRQRHVARGRSAQGIAAVCKFRADADRAGRIHVQPRTSPRGHRNAAAAWLQEVLSHLT